MQNSAFRTFEARVRDSLLLGRAERAARALSAQQYAAMRQYYDAAMRRANVANDLVDENGTVPALILYREVVELLVAAVVVSRRADAGPESLRIPAVWDQLTELASEGRIGEVPSSLLRVRELVEQRDPLALDSQPPEQLAALRTSTETTIRWLSDLVEPRTPRQIVVNRVVRIGVAAVVVVGALVWAIASLLRPPNLALHKPVTISERHPASVAPPDNSGLVNGEIEVGYGIHTSAGNAWVMVDLLQPVAVSKVKVYNRADGWFDDGLPFILEFSDDGTHFVEVNRRTASFSSLIPWTFDAGGHRTRYVRIRSDKYIAITEVEVYGRK